MGLNKLILTFPDKQMAQYYSHSIVDGGFDEMS